MATLKPYKDEVKDTVIDALKANLKGVIVLNSVVENKEDEILGNNHSNKSCDNSVSSGQDNKPNVSGTLDEIGVGAKKEGEKMSKKTTKEKSAVLGALRGMTRQRMPDWGMFRVRRARGCRTGTCFGCAAGRDAPGLQV
uniref:Uncharacterized protein n=1 Tax=Solanum tuberosum TaxID=4113 RepID=M1DS54_SOLTU